MNDKEILEKVAELVLRGTKQILNLEEVSVLTGLSKSTLYKKTRKRFIKFHKAPGGKNLFFRREDVEQFMLEREFKTTEKLETEAISYMVAKKGKK